MALIFNNGCHCRADVNRTKFLCSSYRPYVGKQRAYSTPAAVGNYSIETRRFSVGARRSLQSASKINKIHIWLCGCIITKSRETKSGLGKTCQVTASEQGGVVREPVNLI